MGGGRYLHACAVISYRVFGIKSQLGSGPKTMKKKTQQLNRLSHAIRSPLLQHCQKASSAERTEPESRALWNTDMRTRSALRRELQLHLLLG